MTSEFTKKYRKPFYGSVIDGPFEGEWIESDSPYFSGHYQRLLISPAYGLMPVGIEIDRAIYKWLPSYRAWAWCQPGPPPVPRKK